LLVLLWSILVGFLSGIFLNPELVMKLVVSPIMFMAYAGAVFFTCFFPLAGFCADVLCGRHRMVIVSLSMVSASLLILLPSVAGLTLSLTELPIWLMWIFIPIISISFLVLMTGVICFTANGVQFGMDQLHDTPGEDRTLFIH
jgi:hypothetical protein